MAKKEVIIALSFILLALFAFSPVILVALGQYEGPSTIDKIEALVSDRQEIIIALGTLFLLLGLTVWSSHLNNISIERQQSANRMLQSELKIADFRQLWIDELREELARFTGLCMIEISEVEARELVLLYVKISMRLNREEPLAAELVKSASKLKDEMFTKNADAKAEAFKKFENAGRAYLKNEWKRLKSDINRAKLLEVIDP